MLVSNLLTNIYIDVLALLHFRTPPIVIDDSSWKNAAESFTVALTLTLGGVRKCNSAGISTCYFFNTLEVSCPQLTCRPPLLFDTPVHKVLCMCCNFLYCFSHFYALCYCSCMSVKLAILFILVAGKNVFHAFIPNLISDTIFRIIWNTD